MSVEIVTEQTVALSRMECGECGIIFAIPSAVKRERQEHGGSWCCPNGHWRQYRESDVARLQRELAKKQAELDQTKAEIRDQKSLIQEHRKKLLRTKQGVCPCCQRTFRQLQRHMKTKHPEYMP